jgi:hypothetical protein
MAAACIAYNRSEYLSRLTPQQHARDKQHRAERGKLEQVRRHGHRRALRMTGRIIRRSGFRGFGDRLIISNTLIAAGAAQDCGKRVSPRGFAARAKNASAAA